MMIMTGLSHLFKWENLHNWWLTKYFFAPLYIQVHLNKLECRGKVFSNSTQIVKLMY